MRIDELWSSRTPGAAVGRALLTPASWLYAMGWESYSAMYRLGLKKAQSPYCPVVCVGNLVVGGSGKTPASLAVADVLRSLGESVVLSLSGYGSSRSEAATVAPKGDLKALEWGDEPAMVRGLMPDLPLIVGRRRVLAAELAAQQFPNHVFLMDDGFQHLPLRKHITLLLDDEAPLNSSCLPAGPYREPRRNRNKASLILGEKFKLVRRPLQFQDAAGTVTQPPANATMLCAIGNPDSFAQALVSSGIDVTAQRRLPDHDPLTAGKLFDGLENNTAVVVTAKDWVKLRDRTDLSGRNILIAIQGADIQPRAEFTTWLGEQLAGVRAAK